MLRYVLMTAMRNEAETIARTVESVLTQTALPDRWIIVSDGSTDGSDDIVRQYHQRHPWIGLISLENNDRQRSFSRKVHALRTAYTSLQDENFDLVGNLDADITLPPCYYENVIRFFQRDVQLGIAGGTYSEMRGNTWVRSRSDILYPPGSTQMFRRECYESIGGYPILKNGGEDSAAAIAARMKGWRTQLLPELVSRHLRPWGTGGGLSLIKSRKRQGLMDYHLGMHPLYAIAKAMKRINEKPWLIGCVARFTAYAKAACRREPRDLSVEMVAFVRQEARIRVRNSLRGAKHNPSADGVPHKR